MKVTVKNFGCYADKSWKFKKHFTLFSGINGSGKSTVFKAVCYALYGKCKNVKYGATSCTVTVDFGDFKVSRTSKPVKLFYTENDITHESDKAQCLIEGKMGMTWEQFYICTWITKFSIISMTPMERYNVVRTMISSMAETVEDVQKITDLLKENKRRQEILENEKATYLRIKNDFVEIKAPEVVDIPDNLQERIEELERSCKINLDKTQIQAMIDDLESKDSLLKKLQKYKAWLIYMKKHETFNANKKTFEKQKTAYFSRIEQETDALQKKVQDTDFHLLKTQMIEQNNRKSLKAKGNKYWDLSPSKIAKLYRSMGNVEFKHTKQTCPHCEEWICIDGVTVKVYKTEYDDIEISIDDKKSLEELQGLQHPYTDVESIYNDAISADLKLKEYGRILKSQILSSELVRLNKSVGEPVDPPEGFVDKYSIDELEEYISELTQKIGRVDDTYTVKELKAMLKLPDVQAQKTLLQELYKLKVQESQIIQWRLFSEKLQNVNASLESTEMSLKEVVSNIDALMILKVKQKESEILSFQSVIDSLNELAKEYLQKFFNSSINVYISVFNKANTKMSLDMKCEYNGHVYTDVQNFSQGETIKINLAFIFAMNRFVKSRFLLLDEVLANIDKDIIGEIYSILEEFSQEKPVYVIDHNAIEGIFQQVVDFSNGDRQ